MNAGFIITTTVFTPLEWIDWLNLAFSVLHWVFNVLWGTFYLKVWMCYLFILAFKRAQPSKHGQQHYVIPPRWITYFSGIVVAVLSRCMPAIWMRVWLSVIPGFIPGKKRENIRCQVALRITLTRKHQIRKSQNGRFFSCSMNVPLSFHLSILALCSPLCWLSVCLCLSRFYHFPSVSSSLVKSPSNSSLLLAFFLVSFPHNASLCPFRTCFSFSQSHLD